MSQQYSAASQNDKKSTSSGIKKYFTWLSPGLIIYICIILLVMFLAFIQVGCAICSVPKASGEWSTASYDS